jgi:hypothetical protein
MNLAECFPHVPHDHSGEFHHAQRGKQEGR